jgi:ABC-type polysaccharide/polyol phosphate transport system ATPase subunit
VIEMLCNRAIYLSQGKVAADGKPREVLAQYRREAALRA